MKLLNILNLLKVPNKLASFKLMRMFDSNIKLMFFLSATELDLFQILKYPKELKELESSTEYKNKELLFSLLTLGVRLGELKLVKGKYSLRSKLSKLMATNNGKPFFYILKETLNYHHQVFKNIKFQLKGAPSQKYLEEYGTIISNSSRIAEPFIELFINEIVKSNTQLKILEIGCGTGEYLKYYNKRNSLNHGIAIDIDEAVALQAKENIINQNLNLKYDVLIENILNPSDKLINQSPFDLITLFQNIYYFNGAQRIERVAIVKRKKKKKGKLAIVSAFKSKSKRSPYFDIILKSTHGCVALPKIDEIRDELKLVGFQNVEKISLALDNSFAGIIACLKD